MEKATKRKMQITALAIIFTLVIASLCACIIVLALNNTITSSLISINYNPPQAFATATWEEINEVSKIGAAEKFYNVGDEKTITLTNGEELTFVILGFNHDDLADGSGKANISIGMKELAANTAVMNATNTSLGGWDQSKMRTVTMIVDYYYEKLPADLKAVIKTVNKKTTAGNLSTDIVTSHDNLWLFSFSEIHSEAYMQEWKNTLVSTYKKEGEQYEYFKQIVGDIPSGGVSTLQRKLSNGMGSNSSWWLRASSLLYANDYLNVYSAGSIASGRADLSLGVAFGFCV